MAKELEEKNKKNVKKKEKKEKNKKPKEKFSKGMKKELKQVKWPTFKEIIKYTFATIVFCLILILFFEFLNMIMAYVKGLFN